MQEILSFAFVLREKRLNPHTKLIAIFRRQFCIILTVLEENIFSVLGSEYIFFQLAVNIMQNCRLKVAIRLAHKSTARERRRREERSPSELERATKSQDERGNHLKSQCHPKCFARLCFCFEVWLARLLDVSQIIPWSTGLSASWYLQ